MKKSQNMLEMILIYGLVCDFMSLLRLIYNFPFRSSDLHFVYPLGKPIIAHLRRCQGLGVVYTTASPLTPCMWGILDFLSIKVQDKVLFAKLRPLPAAC